MTWGSSVEHRSTVQVNPPPPPPPPLTPPHFSVAEFYHRYEVPRVPVIIADYQHRVTRRTWDLEYFVARCGGRAFAVKRRQSAAAASTGVTQTGEQLEWARLENGAHVGLGCWSGGGELGGGACWC